MLTTDYYPNIGGVAQHIYELAKALGSGGGEIEVIAPAVSSDPTYLIFKAFSEQSDRFKVYRIPFCLNRRIPFVTGQITGRLSKKRFAKMAVERVESLHPDVFHWHALDTHGYPPEGVSVPKVWTNHTSNFIDGIQTRDGLRHYRREATSADQIICPSQELADLTVGIGVPKNRVHFISNGVDAARFHQGVDRSEWMEKLALAATDRLVLCPRRLEKKNGVRFFVDAAVSLLQRGLKDCVFAIAGNFTGPKSDSDEDLVQRTISESGHASAFRLLGRVENKEMPGLYAAATFVVMPSLIEATSLSAMEGMATGKAIVSTNVGGLPFLIRDQENGILVPPENAEALAQGIKQLLDDDEMRSRFGEAGRRRVEAELDWSAIAQQTRRVYQMAMDVAPSRTGTAKLTP